MWDDGTGHDSFVARLSTQYERDAFRTLQAECKRFIELYDELDNAVQDNRDLLAILNGGHRKSTAVVHRSVGDGANSFRVQRFSVWGPKAIATIRVLPSTLSDRSIEIPLKRKRPGGVYNRDSLADPIEQLSGVDHVRRNGVLSISYLAGLRAVAGA